MRLWGRAKKCCRGVSGGYEKISEILEELLEASEDFRRFQKVSCALHGVRLGFKGISEALREASERFRRVQRRNGGIFGDFEGFQLRYTGLREFVTELQRHNGTFWGASEELRCVTWGPRWFQGISGKFK